MSTADTLTQLEADFHLDLAAASDEAGVEAVRLSYLGRKDGRLSSILHALPSLSAEERRDIGRRANALKSLIDTSLTQRRQSFVREALDRQLATSSLDLTLPAFPVARGGRHPLTLVEADIVRVFERMGFSVAEGPEVESDEINFTALNHPPDHPARDAHDTFYLKDHRDAFDRPLLLRTHTSPVQIRYLRTHQPPLAIIAPGRVYRHEAVDATHSFVFHQVEGLAVGPGITLAHLKGALTVMAQSLFGDRAEVRFRASYFPFVEPGLEVDVSCSFCARKGCRVCKGTGWVEMLGAGLVHPQVFRGVGVDPQVMTGYAFGIGVERVAMFKYGVNDLRLFTENDLRFLRSWQG